MNKWWHNIRYRFSGYTKRGRVGTIVCFSFKIHNTYNIAIKHENDLGVIIFKLISLSTPTVMILFERILFEIRKYRGCALPRVVVDVHESHVFTVVVRERCQTAMMNGDEVRRFKNVRGNGGKKTKKESKTKMPKPKVNCDHRERRTWAS